MSNNKVMKVSTIYWHPLNEIPEKVGIKILYLGPDYVVSDLFTGSVIDGKPEFMTRNHKAEEMGIGYKVLYWAEIPTIEEVKTE